MSSSSPHAQVIGDPIAQSKSPLIHGFWLEKLDIPGKYDAEHVTPDGLADYLSKAQKRFDWVGCNVTMPHKQAVIPHLYSVDSIAERIGAVNTIYPASDRLLAGTNTDADGFLEPLQAELQNQHLFRMARIVGTGGAARAIIAALADQGFTLVVAGRNPDKARALLDELAPKGEHHATHLDLFADETNFPFDDREGCLDLVVNASSLGMTGQPPLVFDLSHAPPGSIFYDIVTTPRETPLLRAAKAGGHRTISGLAMLIGQAAIAFEKFYGTPPPREHDAELIELLSQ
ncbi:MAG: shikimate dehydrogenase [Pseudomonadota bacterium]